MKRSRAASLHGLLAGLTLSACLPSAFALADDADDTALAFVQQRHLGDSLGWLGYQLASRTVTFASLVDSLGKTRAQALVQQELQRLQPRYQTQWDRNLAAAYAHAFSADELRQLNDGHGPPALMNRFKARNNEVGVDMKARSSQLLADFVGQALGNAQKTLTPP